MYQGELYVPFSKREAGSGTVTIQNPLGVHNLAILGYIILDIWRYQKLKMNRLNLSKKQTFILATKDNDFIVSPSRNCSEVASVFDNTEMMSYILHRLVK